MAAVGRPSSYRSEYPEQAAKLCRLGATDREIADFFEVDERTLNRWKLDHPEFCQSLKLAKEEADNRVERSLYHRAIGYTFDSEKIFMPAGEDEERRVEIVEHVPPDVTACIFWLKNRRPDLWRDKRDHQLSGKVNIEKIKRVIVDYFRPMYDRIEAPGEGIVLFEGMSDHTAESIKSLEGFDVAYVEEAQTLTKRSLEFLRPTIRKSGSELWFSWNPRSDSDPVDQLLRGENPPAAIGAIWTRQIINTHRRAEAPTLNRIAVAVDPAVSSEDGATAHGIVVCAEGEDGRGYVLEDATTKGGPTDWAMRAVAMFDNYDADAIIAEVNQGGDMVKHTLRTVRPNLPVTMVRATRGKHVRAEPIAALYTTGRVSHVGAFPELEDQMCLTTASGYEGEGSPDRLDALVWLVWGLTNLFKAVTRKKPKPVTVNRVPVANGWMGA